MNYWYGSNRFMGKKCVFMPFLLDSWARAGIVHIWANFRVKVMKLRDKKLRSRKNKVVRADNGHEQGGVLNPLEVRQYEKDRVKKGGRFGKKWFPENKTD